ncbi:hypothetical protein Tco_0185057 [Tanacetum coccineum]
MYSCELCGNDARYGHYCTPQVPFIYPEPCYNQDFNFLQDFHDFQQQYLCCENCGGPHETFQCQPINEDYYHEQNSCNDSNSFSFDQFQPPQYTVNHLNFNAQNELLNSQNKIMEQMTSTCDMDYTIAITPVLSTEEPVDSLIIDDEHLHAVPATKSDEVIKSSVENLVPIPSKSEGIPDSVCDVPLCDNPTPLKAFKYHSEIVVNSNDDDTSSDDDDFEDIEYVEASPPDLEIVSLEESPSPFPIPDSNSFFEKSDTSLSYSDNSLPEFESFSDHTEETSSGSTTTHANNSLPEYDSFHFEIEPDQGELTNVVMEDILGEPRVHTPNVTKDIRECFKLEDSAQKQSASRGGKLVIPQDHEDPCLFSILQSSGLRSFVYSGILNPDHPSKTSDHGRLEYRCEQSFKGLEGVCQSEEVGFAMDSLPIIGNNEAVGGWQKDQNTLRSCNMSGG